MRSGALNKQDREMDDSRLTEFERLCREADQEKARGNRDTAYRLYGQAFDMVGWSGEPFRNLVRSHIEGAKGEEKIA